MEALLGAATVLVWIMIICVVLGLVFAGVIGIIVWNQIKKIKDK